MFQYAWASYSFFDYPQYLNSRLILSFAFNDLGCASFANLDIEALRADCTFEPDSLKVVSLASEADYCMLLFSDLWIEVFLTQYHQLIVEKL